MTVKKLGSKGLTWSHFSALKDSDIEYLKEYHKFHPLDFEDLNEGDELTKLDVYKYYLFSIVNLPVFNEELGRVEKESLFIFIGKNYLITATNHPIPSVERYFARIRKSSGAKRKFFGRSSGYMLYLVLDQAFKDARKVLKELVKETQLVEHDVYDLHTRVTTARLGVLRRNIMFFAHIIHPISIYLDQVRNAPNSFVGKDLDIYFDDVKDTLDSMSIVIENLKGTVDGLFDVNEAFLSHRTNEIIRTLTIISVILMPPTLITSFYGMNIIDLPLASNMPLVITMILLSMIFFFNSS